MEGDTSSNQEAARASVDQVHCFNFCNQATYRYIFGAGMEDEEVQQLQPMYGVPALADC